MFGYSLMFCIIGVLCIWESVDCQSASKSWCCGIVGFLLCILGTALFLIKLYK